MARQKLDTLAYVLKQRPHEPRGVLERQLRAANHMAALDYVMLLTEDVSISPNAFERIRRIVVEDLEQRLAALDVKEAA